MTLNHLKMMSLAEDAVPDSTMLASFLPARARQILGPKLLVKLASLLERFNGNSEMIDHVGHDGSSWLLATSR